MSPLDKCHERYNNDAVYRLFVDWLQRYIQNLDLSPSELREIAMYAAYRVEVMRPIGPFMGGNGEPR